MLTSQLTPVVKWLRIALAVPVVLAFLPTLAQPAVSPSKGTLPDLKKLHALLVIDSTSNLKNSVVHDLRNIESILQCYIPERMCEITVLEGKDVTRQAILDYYRQVRTGPDETLLFYYAGHGKLDGKNRHSFQLQEGDVDPIRRDEVLQAMKAKKPGLAVLLSDCCSVRTRVATKLKGAERFIDDVRPHPVLNSLLFQHRGVVDITAAQDGTGSWGDDVRGGIFTQSFCGLLREQLQTYDTKKARFISWREFYIQLLRKTEETFDRWCEQMRNSENRDIKKEQRTQRPKLFHALPEASFVLAKTDFKSAKTAFAVVSLVNKTGKPLAYSYRWSTDERWKTGKLEKNGKALLVQLVKADLAESRLPRLEVSIPSENVRGELQPRKWIGTGRPGFKDGREIALTTE
jgi:Caspase domain